MMLTQSAANTSTFDPIRADGWEAGPEQLTRTNEHEKRLNVSGGRLARLITAVFAEASRSSDGSASTSSDCLVSARTPSKHQLLIFDRKEIGVIITFLIAVASREGKINQRVESEAARHVAKSWGKKKKKAVERILLVLS